MLSQALNNRLRSIIMFLAETGRLAIPIYLLLLSLVFIRCSRPTNIYTWEAELAAPDRVEILSDSTASNGSFVRFNDTGSLTWQALVKEAGWYSLAVRYRAFGGEKEEYLYKNGQRIPIGFAMSESWAELKKIIYLNDAQNTLQIRPSWGYIDIDRFLLRPARVSYDLSPLRNRLYRSTLRPLRLKVDNYKHSIVAVKLNDTSVPFKVKDYPFQESAVWLDVSTAGLPDLLPGNHRLKIDLENGMQLTQEWQVLKDPPEADLVIVAPYIEHGASVLFRLPDRSWLLVDCAKDYMRDEVVIPLLHQLKVDTLQHFILTHYHDDHDSGDRGQTIKRLFHVKQFLDYRSVHTGQTINVGGANLKILNSYLDGKKENTRSLSLKMDYKGFIYIHGGDTYGVNQRRIMQNFPSDLRADVFHANHHFHGSVDVDYLRAMRPKVVVLQAQQAIYARSAYWKNFLQDTRRWLYDQYNWHIDNLVTLEIGAVVIRVVDQSHWGYETHQTIETIAIE